MKKPVVWWLLLLSWLIGAMVVFGGWVRLTRSGLSMVVYYGCCDPLDGKMREVRMIPNVRKVSMSPWVDEERGAAEIGRDFVYSRKVRGATSMPAPSAGCWGCACPSAPEGILSQKALFIPQ